jgi:hypothetical protein
VRHAGDPGLFASFLQDPEKEIVGVDGGSPCRRKDECLWGGILAARSPPLKFSLDRDGKPDATVAALGLGFDLDAICDASVDSKTVLPLIVPAECEKLAGPESENKEHANNQTVAVAEIEEDNGNLLRREVSACDPLAGSRDCQLRCGVLDDRVAVFRAPTRGG